MMLKIPLSCLVFLLFWDFFDFCLFPWCGGLPWGKGCPPHLCLMQGTNIWASSRDFWSEDGFGSSEGARGEDSNVEKSLGGVGR